MQHRAWVRAVVLAAAVGTAWAPGCEDPLAPFAGITSESSFAQGHSHRMSIPARDIELAPAGERTYTTSTSNAHVHQVTLTGLQLEDLQQDGASVDVSTSTSPVDGHAHNFLFVR